MSFEIFKLSSGSLKEIKDFISDKNINSNPAWLSLIGKLSHEENSSQVEHNIEQPTPSESNLITNTSEEDGTENQFFFTQAENVTHLEKPAVDPTLSSVQFLIKCSIESLEHSNGRLNFTNLEDLSNEELSTFFKALKDCLSENGVFNLCCSVCHMTAEQSLTFLPTLSTHFLLPKIIELENDCASLIKKGICDCTEKFSNLFEQLMLTEILNAEPKCTNLIVSLFKILVNPNQTSFLLEFANRTQELKQWHIVILNMFPSVKLEESSRGKLLKLYVKKANTFSSNKDYAKLVHSFAKANAPFTEEERSLLLEIATLNQTIYKNLINKYST